MARENYRDEGAELVNMLIDEGFQPEEINHIFIEGIKWNADDDSSLIDVVMQELGDILE